jgi:hypothetical protein
MKFKERPDLDELIKRSIAVVAAMSPEARGEMYRAQKRSWCIGELMLDDPYLTHDEAARRVDEALRCL